MSFVGQCPACHKTCQQTQDDLQGAWQCDCGATLFACAADLFDELSIHCVKCGADFRVGREASGQAVRCECGAESVAPTVVLRSPIQETSSLVLAKPRAIVDCPSCRQPYRVTKTDLNRDSLCDCNCIFKVMVGPDRRLIAQTVRSGDTAIPDCSTADAQDVVVQRKRKRSWMATLGSTVVVAFLLISTVMFLRREQGAKPLPAPQPNARVNHAATGSQVHSAAMLASAIQASRHLLAPESVFGSTHEFAMTVPRRSMESTEVQQSGPSAAEPNQKLRLPPLAEPTLPQPTAARERIALVPAPYQGFTFEKTFEIAFADYRETKRAIVAAEASGDANRIASSRQRIGKTLGLLKQTHDLGMLRGGNEHIHELRYFLTWMYFHAGCLPEAAIMGEAVARWGDRDDPATKEAVMLALAALQEANATQWGIPERTGELDRMAAIADLLAKRWPQHPQLDTIWMNLAQSYESFGQSERAAQAFLRVGKSSDHFSAAQLAAGNAYWTAYRRGLPAEGEPPQALVSLRDAARKHFSQGVNLLQVHEKKPSVGMMYAKLSLARIEMLADRPQQAETWITAKPFPMTTSIVTSKPSKTQVVMPQPFVRSVFETLFAARSASGNPAGAKAAWQQMAKLLGPGSRADMSDKLMSVTVEFLRELKTSSQITRQQITTLEGLIAPLKQKGNGLAVSDRLWLGESWSELAARASSDELARLCYDRAAAIYGEALQSKGFPQASLVSAQRRQAELLRRAGKLDAALAVTEQILATTPNVFQLQIEAAATLQQIAIEQTDTQRLIDAVSGPPDSAIWGWNRLVTTLHGVRFSPQGTDQHAAQLLRCQFHLAQCRWLIAKATVNQAEQRTLVAAVSKMLRRWLQTTSDTQEDWQDKLKQLQSLVLAN